MITDSENILFLMEIWASNEAQSLHEKAEIINFAKQELKIRRFIAHCDGENISSYRVMEKLGMSLTDKINGRKNKSSDEDREELTYLLEI